MGETEKSIAAAFAEAKARGGVLLLDEVDSFLCERERDDRAWVVGPVNEFLTQMESYAGILVCTTNLRKRLDPASIRRFDIKIEFKALRLEQRARMAAEVLARLAASFGRGAAGARPEVERVELERAMSRLEGLTPGDFATASRKLRLLGDDASLASLVSALEAESVAKGGEPSRRVVGFGPRATC